MNLHEAKTKAISLLMEDKRFQEKYYPVIMDEYTKQTEFGWVFFFQSYDFLYKNDDRKMLIANSPIMVDKDFDLVFFAGVEYSSDEYIDIYMKYRGDLKTYKEATK